MVLQQDGDRNARAWGNREIDGSQCDSVRPRTGKRLPSGTVCHS
jgi:hypothetical protein